MADTTPPKVFMSYSHDSDDHRAWVVRLATYLRGNGIDVCLDQWDLTLGANLMAYMERAADTEYRVVVVVTSSYVSKADSRDGGTGYEAQMLSASMLRDLNGDRVVPLLRNNPQGTMPAFLEGRLWIDFRDDSQFEPKYEELLRELHGRRLDSAPPIGPNPLDGKTEYESRLEIRNNPARWSAPAESGSVQFVYNQNNGRYTLGHGDMQSTLQIGHRGPKTVYALSDPSDSKAVAVYRQITQHPEHVHDVSVFDMSSRVVDATIGDAVVLCNARGYWTLVEILDIFEREALDHERIIKFRYRINSNRTPDFSEAGVRSASTDTSAQTGVAESVGLSADSLAAVPSATELQAVRANVETTPPSQIPPPSPQDPVGTPVQAADESDVVAVFQDYITDRAQAGVVIAKAVTGVSFADRVVRVTFDPAAAGLDLAAFCTLNVFENLAEFVGIPIAFKNDLGERLRPFIDAVATALPDGTGLGTLTTGDIYEIGTGEPWEP